MKMLTKLNSTKQQRRNQANQLRTKVRSTQFGKSKKKRNRKAINRPNDTTFINESTLALTQSRLARSAPAPTQPSHPFVMCRLDPFMSGRPMPLPDKSGVMRWAADHRTYSVITAGTNGQFYIRVMPQLPFCISYSTANWAGYSVDGTSTAMTTGSNLSAYWWPAGALPNYSGVPFDTGVDYDYAETPNNYVTSRARITSMAFKIWYTGSTMACAGTMTVAPYKYTPNFDEVIDMGVSWPDIDVNANTTYTIAPHRVLAVPMSTMTAVPTYNILSPQAITTRVETGATGLLPHVNTENDWRVYNREILVPFDRIAVGGKPIYLDVTVPSTGLGPEIYFYDTSWDEILVSVEGMASGTTLRVEVVMCIEYEPMLGSSFQQFTTKPEKSDMAVIEITEKVAQNMPIARPISQNSNQWVQKANRMVQAVAPHFGPMGMAVAGVGDAIAAMAL